MNVTVRCDECKGLVKGHIAYTDGFTVGFYLRGFLVVPNKGTQSDIFPEGSQNILCDYDMQNSDGYRRWYGNRANESALRAEQREPEEGETVRSYEDLIYFVQHGGAWPISAPPTVVSEDAVPPNDPGQSSARGGATAPRGGATEPRGGVAQPPSDAEREAAQGDLPADAYGGLGGESNKFVAEGRGTHADFQNIMLRTTTQ